MEIENGADKVSGVGGGLWPFFVVTEPAVEYGLSTGSSIGSRKRLFARGDFLQQSYSTVLRMRQ